MNAVKVETKTVVLIPPRTGVVSEVTWRTSDDAFKRRLGIIVNNAAAIVVEGEAYDALGQWTDETMKALVLDRLELTETQT